MATSSASTPRPGPSSPIYATHDVDEDTSLEIEVDMIDGRLGVSRIRATRGRITGEMLRRVPVAKIVREAGRAFAMSTKLEVGGHTSAEPLQAPEDYPGTGPTPGALRYVAAVYQLAHALGEPPTKAVEATGLGRATAGRWVAQAREAGYLAPAEGPGKAGG